MFPIILLCVYYVASHYTVKFYDLLDSVYGQTTKPVGPHIHVQLLYTLHT